MSDSHLDASVRAVLDAGEGILRPIPTWGPRSLLMPGGRIKPTLQALSTLGTHRGGIDERWFVSTAAAAIGAAPVVVGLSDVVHDGDRFSDNDAIDLDDAEMIGEPTSPRRP